MKVPSFSFLFVAFLAPLLVGLGMFVWLQPKVYMAQSRIEISKNSSDKPSDYDPYFMQTAFELLKSDAVLKQVVDELGLAKQYAQEFRSGPLKSMEAVSILRSGLEVSQHRSTALIELRCYSEDPSMGAEIANRIPAVFLREHGGKISVNVVDRAERPLKPVRPNVPLMMTMGAMMSVILSGLAAGGLRLLLRKNSPEAASLRLA